MAPTETLAEQHFLTIEELCRQIGVSVGLLTSSRRPKSGSADTRREHPSSARTRSSRRASTSATSALAVDRRAAPLRRRAAQGARPKGRRLAAHRSVMTATPIPRTLALTVYGDLDVSEIASCRRAASRSITSWVTQEQEQRGLPPPPRGTRGGAAGLRGLPAHRASRRRSRRARPRRRPSGSAARSCAVRASGACTGSCRRRSAAT